MPIKRKEFGQGKFKMINKVKDHPIAKLLKENTGLAFRADEISKRIKMGEDTVRSMLRTLENRKQIIHKAPYYAWKK